jgi:hypothetical protein
MTQNWTKKLTTKMKMTKNFRKYTKDTINAYVYVENISKKKLKLCMTCNIGVANFVRTWCSTWQWSDLSMKLGFLTLETSTYSIIQRVCFHVLMIIKSLVLLQCWLLYERSRTSIEGLRVPAMCIDSFKKVGYQIN